MNFEDAIRLFDQWGFMSVLIPFILVFTLVYAVLQKTHILGKDKKQFNIVVAFCMGIIVVVAHVLQWFPQNSDPVNIINGALPNIALFLVAIVMFLILIGILGGRATWMGGPLSGWIAIVAGIIVLVIFGKSAGWWASGNWPSWLNWLNDSETQAFVIIVLIFGVVIWFITKEDKGDTEGFRLFRDIGDFFKGKEE